MSIRKHGDILAGQNSINIRTDAELSHVSENPIQNRAVTNALDEKQDINRELITVNGNSINVESGKAYKWNVDGEGTLTFVGTSGKYETIPVYIDLAEGSTVTASGVTLPHDITSSGWYEIKWDGTNGTLEKSDSGNASDIQDATKNQSVQETLDELEEEKVGKPDEFVEGNLMEFDENGNAKDSEIKTENLVVHPGSYDDLTVGLAENLTDPRAPSTNRKFGFDTACGEISISDDGTAAPTLLKGTTEIMNQLVPDEIGEHVIPLINGNKYLYRNNDEDSLVTGSSTRTSVNATGGSNKLIDLTRWFGENNEPTIEQFYKLYPTWKSDDVPYCAGSILNYKGTGVATVGFNAYDSSTGKAELLGGNKYQICGAFESCSYHDIWGGEEVLNIDDDGIFTPTNNGVLDVIGGNGTDTCVHLVWSGYKNFGEPDYQYEPYVKHVKQFPILDYFPEGMNGIGEVCDELYLDKSVKRYGVVDLSTLTWTSGTNTYTANVDAIKSNTTNLVCTNGYSATVEGTSVIVTTDASPVGYMVYELADPIVTAISPELNLSYLVNDFGTEQSLPVNTLTLLTTDLDADIRYSLDFTRTVASYSKIEDDVKQLVEEKDNLARQDGNYADKGGTYTYATQLKDPNAQPVEASYGNRTAAGDVSIADNGTGDVASLQGTTQIQNQLVHDTNMNEKSSTDGKLVVTDAVGGDVTKLLLKGGCVVHNQLVKESVEKTATGTGKLGVEDGVAGNAKSLVMTAPRSVVMNQLVQKINTTNWQVSSHTTGTFGDGIVDFLCDAQYGSARTKVALNFQGNHKYMMYFRAKCASGSHQLRVYAGAYLGGITVTLTTTLTSYYKISIGTTGSSILICQDNTADNFATITVQDAMCVDLTQYFNGNTTLINSINTWDDLVAYDSAFASYVAYNTGTVQGVQPTVKVNHTTDVACPVELFRFPYKTVEAAYADNFDAVTGVLERRVGRVDLGTLTYIDYQAPTDSYPYGYTRTIIEDKYKSDMNIVCGKYITDATRQTDKSIMGVYNSSAELNNTYIVDSSLVGKTGAEIATALSGMYAIYQIATPTTSQYNPTTIPTVDIYNTALQTAGTRQCDLSLTYDGKDQTISLNPSHTYVFNDNEESDSLITNTSTLDVVGGEDQLVDITQLYNGDATKIANIHSYASLSSRFHRYRNLLPYNPGTVEPEVQTVKVYPNEHAYGIIYDPNQNTPNCQKVELVNGNLIEVNEFTSMPCHQLHRCVMSDLSNRTIAYYLDDEDSNKKYNGTRNGITSDGSASVLTGSDGDVMVEIPISYWSVDEDYNGTGKVLWLISDEPFTNSSIHDFFYVSPDGATPRVQYVGAYRASICNADGTPINTIEGALSQSTGTAGTNIARSIAGSLPYVGVAQADLLTRAVRNGGSTVNTKFHQWLMLLMIIEQGSLNTQSISAGYSGGIQNAYCFWRKSGRVNAGNGTAQILADPNSQDMDNFQKFTIGSTVVQRDTLMDADGRYAWSIYNRNASSTRYFTNSPTPSNGDVVYSASTGTSTAGTVASYTLNGTRVIQFQYRGIENPFGEVWEFEHGIQKYSHGILASIKVNNVIYTRDAEKDGASSRAWTNNSTTVWTALSITSTSHAYNDPELTNDTGYVASSNGYVYGKLGYWETLSTNDYTSTEQATAINPSYTWKNHRWPMANGYVKKFNPRTFFNLVNGGNTSTYMCDYYYDQAGSGSRVVSRGGTAADGSYDGLGFVNGYNGLGNALVRLSGRLSA